MKLKTFLMAALIGCTSTVAFADGPTYVGKGEGKDVTNDGEFPFTISYTIVYNENKTLTVSGELNWGDNGPTPGLAGDFHIYFPMGNHDYTQSPVTTTQTYELNENVTIQFWQASSAGRTQIEVQYVVGSTSDGSGGGETPEQPEHPEQPVGGATYIGHYNGSAFENDIEHTYTIDYWITYNEDQTLTLKGDLIWGENGQVSGAWNEFNAWFDKHTKEVLVPHGGSVTTVDKFNYGDEEPITFWFASAIGRVESKIIYIVGSEGEETSVKIEAAAENITYNSADITYTVSAPEGLDCKVYYKSADQEEFAEATTNPIKLENLNDNTSYSYELYAVVTEDGEQIESNHVTVTFRTPSESAIAYVYSNILNAQIKNAYLPGEAANDAEAAAVRRNFYVSVPWKVTYDTDETAIYSADLSAVPEVVGLVKQIYIKTFDSNGSIIEEGFRPLSYSESTNTWNYEFGSQTIDNKVEISLYLGYNGGSIDKRHEEYNQWGLENEDKAPVLGKPAKLELLASETTVKCGDRVIITPVLTDANGYYLSANNINYSIADAPNYKGSFNNNTAIFIPDGYKGTYIVEANLPEYDLKGSVRIYTIASPEATNLISGQKGITDTENIQAGTVENVTDDNRESQLEWNCTSTQEHYLIYDLGSKYYIEGIDLLFEGAYATEFTLTLTNTAPEELGAATVRAAAAAADDDVVFTPAESTTQHYFTQSNVADKNHQYVVLRTTAALNTGWGIKVRDLKVYGTTTLPSTPTDVKDLVIDNVDNSNAPVEFYNLNGQRVNNPAGGIFIRRQGTNVSKVIIR